MLAEKRIPIQVVNGANPSLKRVGGTYRLDADRGLWMQFVIRKVRSRLPIFCWQPSFAVGRGSPSLSIGQDLPPEAHRPHQAAKLENGWLVRAFVDSGKQAHNPEIT